MAKSDRKEFKGVRMTYKELGSTIFHQTINLLRHAEGVPLDAMTRINQLWKRLQPELDRMSEKYVKEVQTPFHEALKANGIEWEEGGNPPDLDEEKTKLFKELQAEHDKRLGDFEQEAVYIDTVPLGPQHVKDIKSLNAARLDSLGGLYDHEGQVREQALRRKIGAVK